MSVRPLPDVWESARVVARVMTLFTTRVTEGVSLAEGAALVESGSMSFSKWRVQVLVTCAW